MQLTCRLGHPGAGLRVQASTFQRASAASRSCVSTLPLAVLSHSSLQTFSTVLTGTVRINLGSSFLPLKVHPRTLGVGGSGLGQDQQASAVHKWSRGVHTMSAAGEHQVAVIGAGGEGTFSFRWQALDLCFSVRYHKTQDKVSIRKCQILLEAYLLSQLKT
jgi:hypothetical protein